MRMDIELTADHEQCLREQAITAEEPGAVLHDFEMLLDFLEDHRGVEAAGKYNLLPLKFIDELDRRLSRPLHLGMKRPQLKSHPYLQGLHLLLRASGLSHVEGAGAARLMVDPAMLVQWEQLNPTEQYFNLLEAWLRFGRPEMIGSDRSIGDEMASRCLQAWQSIPEQGEQFDTRKPTEVYLHGISRDFYQLALMDLFGLIEVELPGRPVMPWCPAGVKRIPFGDAVFSVLYPEVYPFMKSRLAVDDDEQEDDEVSEGPRFGAWQPLFQPYFPEWRQNLEFPDEEPREGTCVFRVSYGKVWRLIALPADDTLDDLLHWVLRSFKFDRDHLCAFTYRNRMGATVRVNDSQTGEWPTTDDFEVGTLPLEPGQSMELLYDFGDHWEFTITLDRVEPPGARIKAPGILESHGKAPRQYPRWDE
jgi:Plasmid pRiA4b ORF-3-like protein